ncbi:AMP-binding enzyme [Streptomyces zinciresistens]|uniref:AMP-binding enzyme n=1 Tax=Streptomyces zinciresistens TaxID=1073330 RepID=UPI0031344AC9
MREAAAAEGPGGCRGETAGACISLRPGARPGPGDLAAYCEERLTACACPRQAEILPDRPGTASGKILRRGLPFPGARRLDSSGNPEGQVAAEWPGRRTVTARPSRSGCSPPPPGSSPSRATTAPPCRRSSRRPA